MQSAINALAVFSFVGVVVLFFGVATLLKIVRDLQSDLLNRPAAAGGVMPSSLSDIAEDGRAVLVLAVSGSCPECRDRATELVALAERSSLRMVLVSADRNCADWGSPAVRVMVDARLLGQLAVAAVPTAIRYDAGGAELARRIVGSSDELAAVAEAGVENLVPSGSHAA